MAWPTSTIGTTNLDAGSDNAATARADIKAAVDAVNAMINNGAPLTPDGSGLTRMDFAAPTVAHRTGGQDVSEISFAVVSGRGRVKITARDTAGANARDVFDMTASLTVIRAPVGAGLVAIGSDVELTPDGGTVKFTNAHIHCSTDNTRTCGTATFRWSAVYAVNGTIQTSDARDKTDLEPIDPAAASRFLSLLAPVTFRWIVGGNRVEPSGEVVPEPGRRFHAGFIAQDVRRALTEAGLDRQGRALGLWVSDNPADPAAQQHLRPDQFLPLIIAAWQHLAARVAVLEQRAG